MALFGKRKPAFQLSGLIASPDGLYDGSFLSACTGWWNYEAEHIRGMPTAGYRAFTPDEVRRLCAVVQPDNRPVFKATAAEVGLPGRVAEAVLSLAYVFALVASVGARQPHNAAHPDEAEDDAAWRQAPPFSSDDLAELRLHYSIEGVAREYELWMPFWLAALEAFTNDIGPKLIASGRASFDDQLDRWAISEGNDDFRRGIGPDDYALIAHAEGDGPVFFSFVDHLFEWGGRLRYGEHFLAMGRDFAQERFGKIDETGLIDYLYTETFNRYIPLASQTDPVEAHIVAAVEGAVAWLGEGRSGNEQLTIATVAKRGYLWRRAHDRVAYHFMEPGLSEAIAASRSVGEDRGTNEPYWLTLYYAASQCIADGVHTRLGSVGGLLHGAKTYEMALYDTTDDLADQGYELGEQTKRLAFQFGVSLADVEHMLTTTTPSG